MKRRGSQQTQRPLLMHDFSLQRPIASYDYWHMIDALISHHERAPISPVPISKSGVHLLSREMLQKVGLSVDLDHISSDRLQLQLVNFLRKRCPESQKPLRAKIMGISINEALTGEKVVGIGVSNGRLDAERKALADGIGKWFGIELSFIQGNTVPLAVFPEGYIPPSAMKHLRRDVLGNNPHTVRYLELAPVQPVDYNQEDLTLTPQR